MIVDYFMMIVKTMCLITLYLYIFKRFILIGSIQMYLKRYFAISTRARYFILLAKLIWQKYQFYHASWRIIRKYVQQVLFLFRYWNPIRSMMKISIFCLEYSWQLTCFKWLILKLLFYNVYQNAVHQITVCHYIC